MYSGNGIDRRCFSVTVGGGIKDAEEAARCDVGVLVVDNGVAAVVPAPGVSGW